MLTGIPTQTTMVDTALAYSTELMFRQINNFIGCFLTHLDELNQSSHVRRPPDVLDRNSDSGNTRMN